MRAANILYLGVKELRSLARDPVMLMLIIYAFSLAIYTAAEALPQTLNKAPVAIVDEDRSPLSARISGAFYPPYFVAPVMIGQAGMDAQMDAGIVTFALNIPPDFQRDVLAGRAPVLQLNVDATRMSQAFSGSGYVQAIAAAEVREFVQGYRGTAAPPAELVMRARFNPQLQDAWFGSVMELVNSITMLSLV
ncbi:unnamed protein product, partial [Phaeothamnion confervicola]